MNEPVLIQAAINFASQIKDHTGTDEQKITWGFRKALARKPSAKELQILMDLFAQKQGSVPTQKEISQSSDSPYKNNSFLADADPKLIPWFYVAHTLMNLDEVIRKR